MTLAELIAHAPWREAVTYIASRTWAGSVTWCLAESVASSLQCPITA